LGVPEKRFPVAGIGLARIAENSGDGVCLMWAGASLVQKQEMAAGEGEAIMLRIGRYGVGGLALRAAVLGVCLLAGCVRGATAVLTVGATAHASPVGGASKAG
jgi:hypothetical protein